MILRRGREPLYTEEVRAGDFKMRRGGFVSPCGFEGPFFSRSLRLWNFTIPVAYGFS